MKSPRRFLILFLVVTFVTCGCTQPVPDTGAKLTFDIPSTPVTTVTTVPITSTGTPVTPEDPIVGHWYCMVYPSWGAGY
jgi:hypothetical protein